jgi:sialate O-acetylesterase
MAAGFKLAEPFGGAMVLQRDMPVPVWGEADPETEITVTFAGQKKTAVANAKRKWQLTLDPLSASAENRTFTVTGGDETVVFQNVLVGDVWICSGQSNMEMGVLAVDKTGANIADADFPLIRLRYSDRVSAGTPQTQFTGSTWQVCSPKTLRRGGWGGFSAVGFFFGRDLHKTLNVPVGLIQLAWGGTRIEPWTPRRGFKFAPGLEKYAKSGRDNGGASNLYNAMVSPVVRYGIRGAIWYQGESNLGETNYADKMRALILGWRSEWEQGDFPFYYVQLAPFSYRNNHNALPFSWEQQVAALSIPNTGMAIINDIGDIKDIHPLNKTDVSARLARLALSRTYGVKFVDDTGPIFKAARVEGDKVVVEFNHAASGLVSRDGKPLSHFEIAGADGIFFPAQATIKSGGVIEVSAEQVSTPTQVHFAWNELAEPNLGNGEKLPASAFRWTAPIETGAADAPK